MTQNKSVEEIIATIIADCKLAGTSANETTRQVLEVFQQERQTSQEREREIVDRILALKINMPSEREYSTNPTSAYRTGFEEAVCMYRERIKNLTNPNKD